MEELINLSCSACLMFLFCVEVRQLLTISNMLGQSFGLKMLQNNEKVYLQQQKLSLLPPEINLLHRDF